MPAGNPTCAAEVCWGLAWRLGGVKGALQLPRTAQELKGPILDALRKHGGRPFLSHNKNELLLTKPSTYRACVGGNMCVSGGGGQHRVTDMREAHSMKNRTSPRVGDLLGFC